ncbi:hypothetical protein ASE28_08650 [Acidovorax sp. Root219]|nr:hypothetical protein ASE28_08650 [Acidovorax sp. Root219]
MAPTRTISWPRRAQALLGTACALSKWTLMGCRAMASACSALGTSVQQVWMDLLPEQLVDPTVNFATSTSAARAGRVGRAVSVQEIDVGIFSLHYRVGIGVN